MMNIELCKWAVRGDKDALLFLAHIHDIAHLADDIADGDVGNVQVATEELLMTALVTLPRNTFYLSNFGRLQPMIANAITHWAAANSFEREQDAQTLDRAFVLRSMYATLIVSAAEIVAGDVEGPLWAREVARKVWAEHAKQETVSGYIAEVMRPPEPPPPEAATQE